MRRDHKDWSPNFIHRAFHHCTARGVIRFRRTYECKMRFNTVIAWAFWGQALINCWHICGQTHMTTTARIKLGTANSYTVNHNVLALQRLTYAFDIIVLFAQLRLMILAVYLCSSKLPPLRSETWQILKKGIIWSVLPFRVLYEYNLRTNQNMAEIKLNF